MQKGIFHDIQGRNQSCFYSVKQSAFSLSSIILPSCTQSVHQIRCMKSLNDCSPAKSPTKTTSTTSSRINTRTLTATVGRKMLATTYSPLNETRFPLHGLLAGFCQLSRSGFSCFLLFCQISPPNHNGT